MITFYWQLPRAWRAHFRFRLRFRFSELFLFSTRLDSNHKHSSLGFALLWFALVEPNSIGSASGPKLAFDWSADDSDLNCN